MTFHSSAIVTNAKLLDLMLHCTIQPSSAHIIFGDENLTSACVGPCVIWVS